MIYLNAGFLKPMVIILSVVVLPMFIACLLFTIANFELWLLAVSIVLLFVYFLSVFGVYKYSKTTKYYLVVQEDNSIAIKYPNLQSDTNCLILVPENIVKIEYYRLASIRAWCMLYNYVCPQCAYITYVDDGGEICKHIGYPDFKKIRQLGIDLDVRLVVR